ncbi:TldE/PmbA family protein [Betaproteobacteria bacterium GR16-43]|nr:TldE/PmbA family protein [Betaproteobacteria bacterium GR16-43]
MKQYFHDLAAHVDTLAKPGEVIVSTMAAENSDFIRFNKSAVRQAMGIRQVYWTLSLIRDNRRLDSRVTLAGRLDGDRDTLGAALAELRNGIGELPVDPFLLYQTEPAKSSREGLGRLPNPSQVIEEVVAAGRGLDLVGLYAGGPIYRGFANTLGTRYWHAVESFNFGWCLYHDRDKAVKTSYAGNTWDGASFGQRMGFAREQLARLAETPRTLAPGSYRAFIAPSAMTEILGMLSWAGFGLKSRNTKQTALIRMADQGATLSPQVSLLENTGGGMACGFQAEGFMRPSSVPLVERGRLAAPLVSPRSSREYDVPTNGANASESPESLDLAGGSLANAEALAALGTGIYVGNLWYLNFSDRSACRMTGMTRFASFWVENGQIQAPLNVMRFDDTVYRVLGDNLEALTRERDLIVDDDSYSERSTSSMRTPGALLKEFALTL